MSAAAQVWTLDTAGLKYVDRDRIDRVIRTNATLALTFTDDGVGGRFIGTIGNAPMTCTDGFKLQIECDPRFEFKSSADGSSTLQNGEVCFIEDNNVRHPHRVVAFTITDADGVGSDNIVSITFESVLTGLRFTWTNVNSA